MHVATDELQEAYWAGITGLFDGIAHRPGWLIDFAIGVPGPVLVQQSEQSRLLAIGTGGHVGVQRLLVGSVSHYCLSHAWCPVAAIPVNSPQIVADHSGTVGAEGIS